MHTEKSKVLIVEDEPSLCTLLQHFFEMKDELDVIICSDLEEAEGTLRKGFAPDVALVDFAIGSYHTSVDLCRDIKRKHPSCILFLMSGCVTEEIAKEAGSSQVDAFLEKPFSFKDLEQRINKVLSDGKSRTFGLTRFPSSANQQLVKMQEMVDKYPHDVSYRRVLAFSLYVAERYKEALKVYETVSSNKDITFISAYYAGHTCARLHMLDRAIDFWVKAETLADTEQVAAKVRRRIQAAQAMR